MAALELTLNPRKGLKRSDVMKMGELIIKAMKDKRVDVLTFTITDDMKGGANSMMFPFKIVEK